MVLRILTRIKGSKREDLTEGTGIIWPFVNHPVQSKIIHLQIEELQLLFFVYFLLMLIKEMISHICKIHRILIILKKSHIT